MRALVTGAGGFVGGQLLRKLGALAVPTLAFSRREVVAAKHRRVVQGDCVDAALLRQVCEEFRPTVLFHCAMTSAHPRSVLEEQEMLRTALLGTSSALDAARWSGCSRFVFTGSFLCYQPSDTPLDEAAKVAPQLLRGVAKAGASMLVQCAARDSAAGPALSTVELRLFSVYGRGEGGHRLIPTLVRAALDGSPVRLNPLPRHDWVHIDDVTDALLAAAATHVPPGSIVNIASGIAVSNADVLSVVETAIGRRIVRDEMPYPPSPADASTWCASIDRAALLLDWRPTVSLHDGIRRSVHSYD